MLLGILGMDPELTMEPCTGTCPCSHEILGTDPLWIAA